MRADARRRACPDGLRRPSATAAAAAQNRNAAEAAICIVLPREVARLFASPTRFRHDKRELDDGNPVLAGCWLRPPLRQYYPPPERDVGRAACAALASANSEPPRYSCPDEVRTHRAARTVSRFGCEKGLKSRYLPSPLLPRFASAAAARSLRTRIGTLAGVIENGRTSSGNAGS
jgi:hypothetical protein